MGTSAFLIDILLEDDMTAALTRDIPALDVDPFSREFFEDPHPIHEALREAGPVVRLARYGVLRCRPLRGGVRRRSPTGRPSRPPAASACRISPARNPGGPRASCWRPIRPCTTGHGKC